MSYDQRLTPQIRNIFTGLVKAQPILYNDADRSQEAKDERDRIWNSIGQRIGIHGDVCKVKFTNMKNNYFNSLRKGYVSDTLKERLGFLDEFTPWNRPARIDARRRTMRQSIYIREDTDESMENAEDMNEPQDSDVQSTMPGRSDQKIRANRIASDNKAKVEPTNVDSNSSVNESGLCAESDDLTIFFKNMEQTARKFDGLTQVQIKRMISDIIYDAEEKWLKK